MNFTQFMALAAAFIVLLIGLFFCVLVVATTLRSGDKAAGCFTVLVAGVCLLLILVCLYVAMAPVTV